MEEGCLNLMISRQKCLTSSNIVINRLFPERYFSQSLAFDYFNRSPIIAMYLLPCKTQMDFRDRREKNKVPKIADLLRYCPMLRKYKR